MVKLKDELALDAVLLQGHNDTRLSGKLRHHNNRNLLHQCRPICPYISSTFVDLEDEFKHLHSEIFPKLNDLCNERGSHFLALDFRRTAVDNRSSSDYILKHSLDQIISSLPFFMCVIGSQYGPHRPPVSQPLHSNKSSLSSSVEQMSTSSVSVMDQNWIAACNEHPWIIQDEHQFCSMMELEIILACFSSKTHLPKCCHFYIKDCYQTPATVSADGQAFFEPESEYAQERLNLLKRRIVNKGLSVKFFVTKEDLGKVVFDDWSEIIHHFLASPLDDLMQGDDFVTEIWCEQTLTQRMKRKYFQHGQLTNVEEQLTSHASYMLENFEGDFRFPYDDELYVKDAESLAGYKIGDGIFSTTASFLDSFKYSTSPAACEGNDKNIFVLVGGCGTGKTSLLANWIPKFRKHFSHLVIISEFVGTSHVSYDLSAFLRRCIRTLREKYFQTKSTGSEMLSDVQNYAGLVEAFASSLHLMPCIIVIDGVSELRYAMGEDIGKIRGLNWLPKKIPSSCRMILSTRKSDLSYKMLQARNDTTFHWLPLLNQVTRKQMFESFFKSNVFRILGREVLEKIWTNRLSDRPLFLSTLAELLRSCRGARDINVVVDKCTVLRIFRDFWHAVFVFLSRRFSWSKNSPGQPGSLRHGNNAAGWVAEALKMIILSRSGLHRAEIIHLLSLIGYKGRSTVTPSDWDMFRAAAGGVLVTNYDGSIRIGHEDVNLVLRLCLFVPGRHSSNRSTTSYVENKQQQYHALLGSYFLKYSPLSRKIIELPWQLQQAKDWLMLCQVLCRPRFFLAVCEESQWNTSTYLDYVTYWKELYNHDFDVVHCLKTMIRSGSKEQEESLDMQKEFSHFVTMSSQSAAVTESRYKLHNSPTKGPSLIAVTQHDDTTNSLYRGTEDSRSETEERDFSETESYAFFLTEAEVGHHLLVGGWNPIEDNPEKSIDSTPLDSVEICALHQKVSWLLFQLGEEFTEMAIDITNEAIEQIENLKPLSLNELLALYELITLKCRHCDERDVTQMQYALDIFRGLPFQVMELSLIRRRCLRESAAHISLQLAEKFIEQKRLEEAHSTIMDVLEDSRKCDSIECRAQATRLLGKLIMFRGLLPQSEEMLTKAFSMIVQWNGRKHVNVATVLQDLGLLYAFFMPHNRVNQRKAMLAYKQALEVLQFNKRQVEAAKVSSMIGHLLVEEGSLRSKKEAQLCFEQSLDVLITKQVPDKTEILDTTRNYKHVTSDLKAGRFTHGRARIPDTRTPERPYSGLSWHSNELNRIVENEKEISPHTTPCEAGYQSLKRSMTNALRRPYSAYSSQSVGSHVLLTPRTPSKQSGRPRSRNFGPRFEAKLREYMKSDNFEEEQDFNKTTTIKLLDELDADEMANAIAQVKDRYEAGEVSEQAVIIIPGERSSRMSGRMIPETDAPDTTQSTLDLTRTPSHEVAARSEISTPKRSVRLQYNPVVIKQTRKLPQRHHCDFVSGPRSISMTVHGPYSAVTDVLSSPPRSRRSSGRSVDVYHKSAWYHVPGRYAVPGEVLPSKRNQFRRHSGSAASSSRHCPPIRSSRSLPTSRLGGERNHTSVLSGKAREIVVFRRHSDPHLHVTAKVAFDTTANEKAGGEQSKEVGFVREKPQYYA